MDCKNTSTPPAIVKPAVAIKNKFPRKNYPKNPKKIKFKIMETSFRAYGLVQKELNPHKAQNKNKGKVKAVPVD
ncbi:MAG: hypothetical protein K1X29_04515 [Bdellovibrionales bacterium]|nr:hypothetical protein [Bdellovibrionales bacterium]